MKFEKRDTCEYCNSKMDSKYRSKRFCSPKCRVYFARDDKPMQTEPETTNKSAPYNPVDRIKKLQEIKKK